MNEPKLEGNMILMEVPNQTTFSSFEAEKNDLLTYLKNHLNNHIIFIEVIVNEEVANKNAYTDTDKLERLKSANPAIELLLKTFDLSY